MLKRGEGIMKSRLFLGFMLLILLGGCLGKEVTLYTIPKEVLVSAPKDAPFPVSYPTKLPFQADSLSTTVIQKDTQQVSMVFKGKEGQELIVEITKGKAKLPDAAIQETTSFGKDKWVYSKTQDGTIYLFTIRGSF